jgi:hypothetical protein
MCFADLVDFFAFLAVLTTSYSLCNSFCLLVRR